LLAVTSGKGGVGKSVVTSNLAMALDKLGQHVGILDADISCPSQHVLLPPARPPYFDPSIDKYIPPMVGGIGDEKGPIKLASIGTLCPHDQFIAFRGPLLDKAVKELMNDCEWGDTDIVLVDTPPGTHDVHMSLAELGLTAAVAITTESEVVNAAALRGIKFLNNEEIPMIGVIENFAKEGRKPELVNMLCDEVDADLLGSIPRSDDVEMGSETGEPLVALDDKNPISATFLDIGRQILDRLDLLQ
ncbi:Mrp/NBP35 ATP-binding protein, partial [Kipferlia bialata]